MFDLSTYSSSELSALLKTIPREINRREAAEKTRVRKEVEELAAKYGYDLEDLVNQVAVKTPKTRNPAAIRYRSPDGQTWTGQGRTPKWLSEAMANGASKNDFAVQVEPVS